MKSQRGIGIILSYLSVAVSSIVGICFTPYVISSLGPVEYGLYQLLYATIGYVALLDFGLGGTLTRFILKYRAEGHEQKVNSVITMGIKLYALFGFVAVIIVGIVSLYLDKIYIGSINNANIAYARKLFLIMGVSTGISLVSHALTGIQTASEKYGITKGVFLFKQLFRVICIYALMNVYRNATALVIADLIITIIIIGFDWIYCEVGLKVHLFAGQWQQSLLKQLFSFATFVFIQTIVTQINNGLDRIILGRYSTLEYVALYGVVMQLHSLFNSIGGVISGIALPRISAVVYSNPSREDITNCCVHYSRYQLHISALLIAGFLVFGEQFASLWVPEYDAHAVYFISMLIIFPQVFEAVEGTIFNVMKAKNLQAARSMILLGVAVFNVILTISLIQSFPVYGAAFGTFISFILGNTILSNVYYHKKVGIDILRYFKLLFQGILPAWCCAVIAGFVIRLIPFPGWLGLTAKGGLFVTVYVCLILNLGLNKSEKTMLKLVAQSMIRRWKNVG